MLRAVLRSRFCEAQTRLVIETLFRIRFGGYRMGRLFEICLEGRE